MKKIRLFIMSICAFLGFAASQSHANFSGFVEQLTTMNIPVHKVLSNTGISRYDIARLLNAIECKDCITPNSDYTKKYTSLFRDNFSTTPGKDFRDIFYKKAVYNKKDYYYCVAYVGDKTYMRGYPQTSPVCAGKFCGTQYTTKAEFLQVIMNIIAKYVYPLYTAHWKNMEKWTDSLFSWEYKYKTFTKEELDLISQRAKECGNQTCGLQSANELNIYLKYCMFNLKECGMIPFDKIKEGYWPVAELNILYRQQMISINDAAKYNIGSLIDGKLAVEIFSKANDLIGCSFNNDYDCDGIINSQDSCPNIYSPQQKDLDKDGIGNVCDDDIDGDKVKNPVGIVDDNDNINIALLSGNNANGGNPIDNCLFIVNTNQADNDNNGIGDACQQQGSKLSLSIEVSKIEGVLPKTISFRALSKGPVKDFQWDFGDGSLGSGIQVTHTYFAPGNYTVRLFAQGAATNDAYAKTTVIIGRDPKEKQGLQVLPVPLISSAGKDKDFTLSALGKHDEYKRSINGTSITTKNPDIKYKFMTDGSYPISVKAISKGEITAITMFSLGVGNNGYGSMMTPSTLIPDKYQKIIFETRLSNFLPTDIASIVWNFGDGITIENKETSMNYIYKSAGKKVVFQTIFLKDGSKLQNMITIFVNAENLFSSYVMQLTTSSLDLESFEKFDVKILPLGDTLSSIFFANFIAGDGINKTFSLKNRIVFPLKDTHFYNSPGLYYPQANISLDMCHELSAQATLAIAGQDFCLEAHLNGTLNQYTCDMDKDGIPDICDIDIDGDGTNNLLGIISPGSPKNCAYIKPSNSNNNSNNNNSNNIFKNLNTNLLQTTTLKQHFQGVCYLDNAPFSENSDQKDNNNNGIGDIMEIDIGDIATGGDTIIGGENSGAITTNNIDTDGDGILDHKDLCPLIPETQNGITDFDGCPELGIENYCNNNNDSCGNGIQEDGETCETCPQDAIDCLFVGTTTCLECPCPFIDINSDLTDGDIIKAVLWDKQKKYPWGYSLGSPISLPQ